QEQRQVWKWAAAAGLFVLALALALARFFAPSLQEFARASGSIAKGHFGQKVYGTTTKELKELAQAFNHMSEQLALQFAQVEEDRQQLRTVLSGMVEGVIALDGG